MLCQSPSCERARAWVSASLDGKLSELERRALSSHLRRCCECQAFATSVRTFTDVLRETPLEELSRTVSFRAPRTRSQGGRRLKTLTGIATACGLAFAFVIGRETTQPGTTTTVRVPPIVLEAAASDDSFQVVRDLRDFSLARTVRLSALKERNRPGPQAN